MYEPTLDCNGCGNQLRKITRAQEQAMAENPYKYVVFCLSCQKDQWKKIATAFD